MDRVELLNATLDVADLVQNTGIEIADAAATASTNSLDSLDDFTTKIWKRINMFYESALLLLYYYDDIVIATINQHDKLYRFDKRANDERDAVVFERRVPRCFFKGRPIKCTYVKVESEDVASNLGVDAVSYHASTDYGCWIAPRRANYTHLRVVTATESSVWNNCLDQRSFMKHFDIEMTYRLCSQVPMHYYVASRYRLKNLLKDPVPFSKKKNAVAFITSDCRIEGSGRISIVREVERTLKERNSSLQLLSYGSCMHNAAFPANTSKIDVLKRHKFCIAFENSVHIDYVTEKIWDSLVAGCIPIYLGAPNIREFLPDPHSAILYGQGDISTPHNLVDYLEHLAKNESVYNSKLAWKKKKYLKEFPSTFQALVHMSEDFVPHVQCQLCVLLAQHKNQPKPHFTTCLWNQTWLKRVIDM